MQATVRATPYEVRQRLAELDLSVDPLLDAVQAVAAAHAGCTPNDPPGARCWDGWRMGTRRLRELLCPRGWEKDDTDTFSVIVNHGSHVRVVVVNSTTGTGLLRGVPLNVARKGPRSEDSADVNRQLVFDIADFVEEFARRERLAQAVKYATWCLCVYVSEDIVRAELSQPVEYSRGYVLRWEERIILLGDIPPGEALGITPSLGGDGDDGLSPDFPISVQRK